MSKSVHAELRTARQQAVLPQIFPTRKTQHSDRVLNLAANELFAQAVAEYNSSTPIEQTFSSEADAAEMAELLRPLTNVRYISVTRTGCEWTLTAEQLNGPTTDDLARMAADGQELAFWALFARLLPKIESSATSAGILNWNDGPGAVFDDDDAFQRLVEILWGLLADLEFNSSFVGKFNAAARNVFGEARNLARAYSIPLIEDRRVEAAIRRHGGDLNAAAEDMANNPERTHHVSKEKFFAVVAAMDGSRHVEFDPTTGDQNDPTQSDALSAVESGFENEALDNVWQGLDSRDREILTLRYGLDGSEAVSAEDIADQLGLTKRRVNQLLKGIHDRVAAGNLTDARKYAPVRSNASRKTEAAPVPEFPVQTRTVADEVPAQTVADLRANPQDGIRSPLHIRVVRVDHTSTTGILAGNGAWGNSRRRDYDAPARTRADLADTHTTGGQSATGSPLDEETEARLAAIKTRRSAVKQAEAADFKDFLKRLAV